MTNLTPEGALQRYIDRLGAERGQLVKAIEDDVSNLRVASQIYWAFFGTSKERVDLFNAVSGISAYWIERTMFESLMLGVCKLTDPYEWSKKKRNVTILALPKLLSRGADGELNARIDRAIVATKFSRDWRNRRIAHSDEEVRLGKAKLDVASRARLKNAIEAIAACVRRYALVEFNTSLSTIPIRSPEPDEVSFMEALYLGLSQRKDRIKKREELLRLGEYDKLDAIMALPEWVVAREEEKYDVE